MEAELDLRLARAGATVTDAHLIAPTTSGSEEGPGQTGMALRPPWGMFFELAFE
jgi:hypothetical protein